MFIIFLYFFLSLWELLIMDHCVQCICSCGFGDRAVRLHFELKKTK